MNALGYCSSVREGGYLSSCWSLAEYVWYVYTARSRLCRWGSVKTIRGKGRKERCALRVAELSTPAQNPSLKSGQSQSVFSFSLISRLGLARKMSMPLFRFTDNKRAVSQHKSTGFILVFQSTFTSYFDASSVEEMFAVRFGVSSGQPNLPPAQPRINTLPPIVVEQYCSTCTYVRVRTAYIRDGME